MKKKKMNRGLKAVIIVALVIVILIGAVAIVGPKVDSAGYRYVIGGYLMSYLTPTNKKVDALLDKTDGIIHGVCHPKGDIEGIKSANVDWVRFDLSHTVWDAEGNLTPGYLAFKEDAKRYADAGIKVMCVTPYPTEYLYSPYFGGNEAEGIASSVDPRTEEGLAYIAKEAAFLVQDLQGIVAGIQVTNEMTVDRFRKPLTLEEAARYIAVQLEAMKDVKGDIIVGYNVADFTMFQFYKLLEDHNDCCDYLGLDLYLGCFENTFKSLIWYDIILRGFYQQSGLPMIVNEFGYIGAGQALTDEERTAFLQQFGYNTEEEAAADILNLLENENFNSRIRERMYEEFPDKNPADLADLLFNTQNSNNYRQHFYLELNNGYQLKDYEHTKEDQAQFYTDVITKHFEKMPFLCGCFAYCWADSSSCYICDSPDCPVETGWGFKDLNGNYKPSYYALRDAYAEWQ